MEFMIFYVNCGTRLEYYMRSHRIEHKNTCMHTQCKSMCKQFIRKGHTQYCIHTDTQICVFEHS